MNSIPNKNTQNKKICFVKSGTPPPKRSTNKSGIWYSTNDWKVVTDCNKQYVFPIQIALTALHPDILIYSPSLRHVIIIELTRPCKENMERWHSVKFNKYESLIHAIKENCWAVDLFAVEVAARGYLSRSVLSCLKKLGFPNKLARSTSKILGHTSMTCSFYIWLAQNSRSWDVCPD